MQQRYILEYNYLLKTIIVAISLTAVLVGCNLYSGKREEVKKEKDSLDYYPPTPAALPKAEFRK